MTRADSKRAQSKQAHGKPAPGQRGGSKRASGRSGADQAARPGKGRAKTGDRRWFELPYSADAPRLVNPEIGIASVTRRGPEHSYTMEVTLLDAPDQRLLRAGVVLAHRVRDGRGEWYLDAPTWAPWLPVDEVEPMGHADLPQRLADLVAPFRRWATLGPVAGLTCLRTEFELRDADRRRLALVRDDKVSVSRSGLTVARYREITVLADGLDSTQGAWIRERMRLVGGDPLPGLPSVLRRLGIRSHASLAGAAPPPWGPEWELEALVGGLIGYRHQQLLAADLSLRSGQPGDPQAPVAVVTRLAHELAGLSPVLDPEWLQDIEAELSWAQANLGTAESRYRERYLRLLDHLVLAARDPRLGEAGAAPAGEVLRTVVEQAASGFVAAGRRITLSSRERTWHRAQVAAEQLDQACAVAELVLPEWAGRVRRRGRRLARSLASGIDPEVERLAAAYQPDRTTEPGPTPQQAFADGRRYQQLLEARTRARRAAIADWPHRIAKLEASVQS